MCFFAASGPGLSSRARRQNTWKVRPQQSIAVHGCPFPTLVQQLGDATPQLSLCCRCCETLWQDLDIPLCVLATHNTGSQWHPLSYLDPARLWLPTQPLAGETQRQQQQRSQAVKVSTAQRVGMIDILKSNDTNGMGAAELACRRR